MSQSRSTSKAVSVYLSPLAKEVLDQYVKNSGYGSISRTVEEMILSYHNCYTTILTTLAASDVFSVFQNPETTRILFFNVLSNFKLQNGSVIENIVKNRIDKMIQNRVQRKK